MARDEDDELGILDQDQDEDQTFLDQDQDMDGLSWKRTRTRTRIRTVCDLDWNKGQIILDENKTGKPCLLNALLSQTPKITLNV